MMGLYINSMAGWSIKNLIFILFNSPYRAVNFVLYSEFYFYMRKTCHNTHYAQLILDRVESAILMRISPFFGIINKYSNDKTEVILMRKFLYMLAALLVLIGINTHDVEARTDVYATTYNGNSWYVDQDSVKKVGDVLNFTVYTTSGLSYKVSSSDSNYYNADVFYYNNKLVSDNGQSVWKSPGMMAAMRVARK